MPFAPMRRGALAFISGFGLSLAAGGPVAARSDMKAFQAEVLEILRERYPELRFEAGAEEDVVLFGNIRLGLGNLAAYASDPDPAKRRETILAWFGQSGFLARSSYEAPKESWDAVLPKLRPKLMPAEYLREMPDLVHRPFSDDVRLAYGVDEGNRDRYVVAPHLAGWGATSEALHERAIANLEAMSEDIELRRKAPKSGQGAYVTVNHGDAYDAARIVLPRFRTRLVALLGPAHPRRPLNPGHLAGRAPNHGVAGTAAGPP